MPKRKSPSSEDEEASHSSDGSGASIAKTKLRAQKTALPSIKKPKYPKPTDEGGSQKAEKDTNGSGLHDGVKVLTNTEGEKYIDLGKKRRAVVRSFKKIPLLDIREYYGTDGEEKPGKKGISLTLDQWKSLKGGSDVIDKLFVELEGK